MSSHFQCSSWLWFLKYHSMGVCGGSSSAFALLHPGSAAQEKLHQWSQSRNLHIAIFWDASRLEPQLGWGGSLCWGGNSMSAMQFRRAGPVASSESLFDSSLLQRWETKQNLGELISLPTFHMNLFLLGPYVLGEQQAQVFQPLGRWQLSLLALWYLNILVLSQNTLKTFPVL